MIYPKKAIDFLKIVYLDHKKALLFMVLCVFLQVVFDKLAPFYFSKMIDIFEMHTADKAQLIAVMVPLFIKFCGALLLFMICRRLMGIMLRRVYPAICVSIKKRATFYIANHSMRFLNEHHSGSLGVKVNQLSDSVGNMIYSIYFGFLTSLCILLITFIMLMQVNFYFGALFSLWLCIFWLFLTKKTRPAKLLGKERAEKQAQSAGRIVDILSNCFLLKSFANIKYEEKSLDNLLNIEKKSLADEILKYENLRLLQFLIVSSFQVSLLMLAIYLWYINLITTGNIVLVLFLTSNIMHTFQQFANVLFDWAKCEGTVENALQVLHMPHEIVDKSRKKLHVKAGKIVFKEVDFAYNKNKKVLDGFNLTIKPKEKVGLVGISGSGKSTLINLLQRFFEPKSGHILIDNQDITMITQESLHQSIAVIPQDTALLHRSIFDNIAYGNPAANDKKVYDAANKAYADDFINQLPNKYESMVGEKGIKLSGGQRQRIAVARAILKNAPILILDEATSALDSQSEAYIQESMAHLMRDKTVIAIAHRLSTLQQMDRIIVLQKGKIIEEGSPQSLLAQNGHYAALWKIQTGAKNT